MRRHKPYKLVQRTERLEEVCAQGQQDRRSVDSRGAGMVGGGGRFREGGVRG